MLKKVFLAAFALGILFLVAAVLGWDYWISRDIEPREVIKLPVAGPSSTGVIAGQDGKIYVANLNDFSIYQNGQLVRSFTPDEVGLSPSFLDMDAQGRVWASSYKLEEGLSVFDGLGWQNISGPASASVYDMKADSIGRIWLGTEEGLYLYEDQEWQGFTPSNSELPYKVVGSIAPDRNGQVWIEMAPEGGGQDFALTDGKVWKTFGEQAKTISGGDIAADPQGNLWLGSSDGLHVFDGTQWTIAYTPENSGLKNPWVREMGFDSQGRLWMTNGEASNITYIVFDGENWKYIYTSLGEIGLRIGLDENVYIVGSSSIYQIPFNTRSLNAFEYGLKGIIAKGGFVSLTLFLIGIWLMIALKTWGIGPGLVVGGIVFLIAASGFMPYYFNPGLYTMVGGILGGVIGKFFKREGGKAVYADLIGGGIGCGALLLLTGCAYISMMFLVGR